MIPLKLTLSGFMSYHDPQTLDFQGDSLWVLVGKNASGKSSIFDAIVFALFSVSRIGKTHHDELINHNSDTAEIIFDFAVGPKKYRVKRTITKKGTTYQASILLPQSDGSLTPHPLPGTHKKDGFDKWIEADLGLNYEIFVTSVLLQQGNAEVFLNAETSKRYDVLSKLIDLSKYIALEEKAREQKKFWESQASFHRNALNQISPVIEQDLVDAQTLIERESSATESVAQLAGYLQTLYGQASRWEHLNSDLLSTEGKLSTTQALLDRSTEIEIGYCRLVNLRGVYPALKAAFDLAQTIRAAETEIERLSGEQITDDGLIKADEEKVGNLEAARNQKSVRFQEINTRSMRIFRRLSELAPVMSTIAQIGQLEQALETRRNALDQYPDDLDTRLKESEAGRDQLLEVERVLPGLRRLLGERSKLSSAEQRRLVLDGQLTQKQNARQGVAKAQEDAQAKYSEIEAYEKGLRTAHTKVNTLLGEARRHLNNFNLVAGAAKCQYCGSELSEEHKAEERSRLSKDLAEKEQLEKTAQDNLANAIKDLERAAELLRSTTADLSRLDGEISSISQGIKSLDQEIQGQLLALNMSFDALPTLYQMQISQEKPISPAEWANTVYPQVGDLAKMEKAVIMLPQRRSEASYLARQVSERDQALIRWSEASGNLANTRKTLPADWETLHSEHGQLSASKGGIDAELEAARQAQALASSTYEKAKAELQQIRDRQSRRTGTLTALRESKERDLRNLNAQITQLPENWRAEAAAMTESQLSDLFHEKSGLEVYEEHHQQLAAAEQTMKDLCTHQEEVQGYINALPAEARRSADQVNRELSGALEESRQAQGRLTAAQTRRTQLLARRIQYLETESSLKAAERKSHLYGILSEQFGERGIQKAIINKAEVAIVHLSNQVLDSLSGGRSKLRLREAGGNKKALDLEVWDSQTGGDKPILTSLASGSQRFRIAISVALGIGQYIGRESNRIESVIIDEGFGSLDREGRESIIQELYNLRQHLKRIILVSHQEEFARGFSTGYEIHLVDGASQVQTLIR